MREIRLSGSEGGGAESNRSSLPLYIIAPLTGRAATRRDAAIFMRHRVGQEGAWGAVPKIGFPVPRFRFPVEGSGKHSALFRKWRQESA